MSEYEIEPVRGLPEPLPADERILWQGEPSWRGMARRVFHLPAAMIYFGLLLAWYAVTTVGHGAAASAIGMHVLSMGSLMAAALALLTVLAWLSHKTTVYTITNKRVVMRCGIALPMVLNIPFKSISSAGLKSYADGTGDLVLSLVQDERMSYVVLWPHARPWRFSRAEPMLRCVKDAQAVAPVLARALAAAAGVPAHAIVGDDWQDRAARSPTTAAA